MLITFTSWRIPCRSIHAARLTNPDALGVLARKTRGITDTNVLSTAKKGKVLAHTETCYIVNVRPFASELSHNLLIISQSCAGSQQFLFFIGWIGTLKRHFFDHQREMDGGLI